MGFPSGISVHAWHRDGSYRGHDQGKAPAVHRGPAGRSAAGLIAATLATITLSGGAAAEPLRVATFNAELQRDGPGLLLRDILSGDDPKVAAVAALVASAAPDILVLTGIDFDHDGHALAAFADLLSSLGQSFPHRFARQPNTGIPTGRDIDGDGRANGPRDAQGYGEFAGQAGMAILSRHRIDAGAARDFSAFLWADLPGALIGDDSAAGLQRLPTTAHWDVPVVLPTGARVHLLAYYATPPVFDGPDDRNGRRNHDETLFWTHYLDGRLPYARPDGAFVIAGDANLDPADGDGRGTAMATLLGHPRIQDPRPASAEGTARAARDGGVNSAQRGDPALDTADWPDVPGGPGNLRVDYVLPSRDWQVAKAGVAWPPSGSGLRHGLVWVDLLPEGPRDSDVDGGVNEIRR
jgi:hypothetical protein